MRPRSILPLALLALLLAGCAQRQAGPVTSAPGADVDVAGVFQYETILNRGAEQGRPAAELGERVSGTIRIEESQGRYTGEITGTGRSPLPLTVVTVDRNRVTLQARGEDGSPVTLRLVFQGQAFTGQWVAGNGFTSAVRGTRRQ